MFEELFCIPDAFFESAKFKPSLRPVKPGGGGIIKVSRFWWSNIAPPGQAGRGRLRTQIVTPF